LQRGLFRKVDEVDELAQSATECRASKYPAIE
jgi:hypothetical protein